MMPWRYHPLQLLLLAFCYQTIHGVSGSIPKGKTSFISTFHCFAKSYDAFSANNISSNKPILFITAEN